MLEKSRVLVFTTAFRPMIGGSELALEETIRRLPNVFFDIMTPKYSRNFKAFEPGPNFNVYRIGPEGRLGKIIFPVLGFLKAIKMIRRHGYNYTHAYQASYGGGAAWLTKIFNPSLPFILTMQEGKNLEKQFLLNWLRGLIIKKADVVTVISNYLKNYVDKSCKGKKVFLIPNGVDLDKFKISDSRFSDREENKDKVIITFSRLVKKNGIADLIDAFSILHTKYLMTNIRLKIAGDGSLKDALMSKSEKLNLENKINFLGVVPPDKTPDYLSGADVFVRPSLSEGLGTAFLEAMAAGLPVIGTSVGGIPDFLKDGETGLFCKPGNPEDIAEKIKMVLSDDNLRKKLISNGRKLVEEKYAWDKVAARFGEIYLSQ